MTIREKELFKSIFRSILDQDSAPRGHRKDMHMVYDGSTRGSKQLSASDLHPIYGIRETDKRPSQLGNASSFVDYERIISLLKAQIPLNAFLSVIEKEIFLRFVEVSQQSTQDKFLSVYAELLTNAMRRARLIYRNFPAVVAIFDRMHSLGSLSVAYGTTSSVYNELLSARWEGWHQLDYVLDVLAMMEREGIPGDPSTKSIVDKITSDIITDKEKYEALHVIWASEDPERLERLSKYGKHFTHTTEPH